MQRGADKPVEDINKIKSNPQGGKAFGRQLKVQESDLDRIGAEFKRQNTHVEDEALERYKQKFLLYDRNHNGELGLDEVKYMMEKLGQPKTHLELKKMIAQVDKTGSGTIEYVEFLEMMFGKSNSILRTILMFEDMAKEKEAPKGLPPRRSLADLP